MVLLIKLLSLIKEIWCKPSIVFFNVFLLRELMFWTWFDVDVEDVLNIVVVWSVGDGNWKWINVKLSQHI